MTYPPRSRTSTTTATASTALTKMMMKKSPPSNSPNSSNDDSKKSYSYHSTSSTVNPFVDKYGYGKPLNPNHDSHHHEEDEEELTHQEVTHVIANAADDEEEEDDEEETDGVVFIQTSSFSMAAVPTRVKQQIGVTLLLLVAILAVVFVPSTVSSVGWFPFTHDYSKDDTAALLNNQPQQQQQGIKSNNMCTNNNNYKKEDESNLLLSTQQQEVLLFEARSSSTLSDISHGAVASDHALCSQMGVEMMREQHGNAVDAAVTTALCLGVANPGSSGIGGGAFLLVHAPIRVRDPPPHVRYDDQREEDVATTTTTTTTTTTIKETTVIDAREVAPEKATPTMYDDNNYKESSQDRSSPPSLVGRRAMGVPGELRGLELAHAMHGVLPWHTLVQPVADLATHGVAVNANLAAEIAFMAASYNNRKNYIYHEDFGLRELLTHNDNWNTPLQEHDVLRNPKLGALLRDVAQHGAKALYEDRAERLAHEIQSTNARNGSGGIMTAADFRNYKAILRSPIVTRNVLGMTIFGVPPPSSGGAAVIGAARFLAGFAPTLPLAAYADTLSLHVLSEALKHVFAIRMSLSDPAYNTDVVKAAVRDLTTGSYIESLRNHYTRLNDTLPLSQYGGPTWAQLQDSDGSANASDAHEGDRRRYDRRHLLRPLGYLNDHGTSHFSIVDRDGNAVAMTTSINTYFGSTVVSQSSGIIWGNTMDDFSSPGTSNYFGVHPSVANYIAPGKRPLSSMSPTLVFRNANVGHDNDNDSDDDHDNNDDLKLRLLMVVGGSGGPRIISAVLHVWMYACVYGTSLAEAMRQPRIHDQLILHGSAATAIEQSQSTIVLHRTVVPTNRTHHNQNETETTPTTTLHIDLSNRSIQALKRRGHRVVPNSYMGTVQAILIDPETGLLTATSDVRKGGEPAGY